MTNIKVKESTEVHFQQSIFDFIKTIVTNHISSWYF